jgi:hypothetical protein
LEFICERMGFSFDEARQLGRERFLAGDRLTQ